MFKANTVAVPRVAVAALAKGTLSPDSYAVVCLYVHLQPEKIKELRGKYPVVTDEALRGAVTWIKQHLLDAEGEDEELEVFTDHLRQEVGRRTMSGYSFSEAEIKSLYEKVNGDCEVISALVAQAARYEYGTKTPIRKLFKYFIKVLEDKSLEEIRTDLATDRPSKDDLMQDTLRSTVEVLEGDPEAQAAILRSEELVFELNKAGLLN